MNETIDLMLNHSSVRRFTEEPLVAEDLETIRRRSLMVQTLMPKDQRTS